MPGTAALVLKQSIVGSPRYGPGSREGLRSVTYAARPVPVAAPYQHAVTGCLTFALLRPRRLGRRQPAVMWVPTAAALLLTLSLLYAPRPAAALALTPPALSLLLTL